MLEGALWLLPTLGFLAAAGAHVADLEFWRLIALASAIVSLVTIALFPQQLSLGSLIGALAVNAAVLVAFLIVHWPSAAAVGS